MAEKLRGELKVIKENEYHFFSVKVGDTWYGTNEKKAPVGVEKGDIVEGEYFLKDDKYKTIVKGSLKKASNEAAKAPAGASASDGDRMSKGEWAQKDQRIQYQHAQKVAATLIGNPAILEAAGVNKAKPSDKLGIIETLFDKYTASVFEDVATFGAVARANGTAEVKDPQAPPSDDDNDE